MTWTEIEDEFGPLVEIAPLADGRWNVEVIRVARVDRRLWTRVEPGLASTGLHYVNREAYFVATKPHPAGVDVIEVDEDIDECHRCLSWTDQGRGSLCSACVRELDEAIPS